MLLSSSSSGLNLLNISHIRSITFPAYFDSHAKDDLVSWFF